MSIPRFALSAPPSRAAQTGEDARALLRTARQIESKGRPVYARITADIKGESFLLAIHQARNKNTHETWTLAAFHSRTLPGRTRRVIIDPGGQTWTLFPETDTDGPRAVCQADKYHAKLQAIHQEKEATR